MSGEVCPIRLDRKENDATGNDEGELRCGQRCPRCQGGVLDYDGMLMLVCPVCGVTQGGGCYT